MLDFEGNDEEVMEAHTQHAIVDSRPGIHRGPWTLERAEAWIAEAESDDFPVEFFSIVSREVSAWTPVE